MDKLYALLISPLAVCPQTVGAQDASDVVADRPNVIYVFPDQFRNAALGFWNEPGYREQVNFRGDPTVTPNINRFARESRVMRSVMSNFPLSSPHRGSLLTGMYPNKSGVPENCNSSRPFSYIREGITTVSDVFAAAGYDCGYIGKLHADVPQRNDPDRPGHYVEDGVLVWDAFTPVQRRHHFNFWYSYGTFDEHKNPHYWDTEGRKHEPHEWSPMHEAKVAAAYIRNEHGVRDPHKPFFLMVGMNPPHSPYRSSEDCMPEDYALYADKPLDSLLVRPNVNRALAKAPSVRYYFASVTGVDRAFGQILQAVKEQGIERNTIVVFASDHGETMCSQNTDDPKNSPYTESMNIPFIVRWPGHVPVGIDSVLMSTPDIMPTLLSMAGLKHCIPSLWQGRDYATLFLDPSSKVPRPDAALYFQNLDGEKDAQGIVKDYFPVARGIKTARYTLALYIDRRGRLKRTLFFDDQADPYQMHNLNPRMYQKPYRQLVGKMMSMLRDIDDPWSHMQLKGIDLGREKQEDNQ